MTNLSPELREESSEERVQRECQTGVLGTGHYVRCHPTGDPEVSEVKSRVSCLLRPLPACNGCTHSKFKMVFNADPGAKLQTVRCPRWKNDAARMQGEKPDEYIETELLTCSDKPYSFCASCPSLERLSQMFVDKTKDGWYSRYRRFSKEEDHD